MRAFTIALVGAAAAAGIFVFLSGSPACGSFIPLNVCIDVQVRLHPDQF